MSITHAKTSLKLDLLFFYAARLSRVRLGAVLHLSFSSASSFLARYGLVIDTASALYDLTSSSMCIITDIFVNSVGIRSIVLLIGNLIESRYCHR